jgi:hypothetical protein
MPAAEKQVEERAIKRARANVKEEASDAEQDDEVGLS